MGLNDPHFHLKFPSSECEKGMGWLDYGRTVLRRVSFVMKAVEGHWKRRVLVIHVFKGLEINHKMPHLVH